MKNLKKVGPFLVALTIGLTPIFGIVTENTAVSEENPANYYSDIDWSGVYQYGSSGGKTLTAIDPYWLITTKHGGGVVGATFTDGNGTVYTIVDIVYHSAAEDPNHSYDSDLALIKVDKPLPTYYEIYTGSVVPNLTEVIMIGTGHAGTVTDNLYGLDTFVWDDTTPRKKRWGTNKISDLQILEDDHGKQDSLIAEFQLGSTPYEAGLGDHDSGSAWLVNEGGVWKLLGIGYGVGPTENPPYKTSLAVDLREYNDWIYSIVPEPTTILILAIATAGSLYRR